MQKQATIETLSKCVFWGMWGLASWWLFMAFHESGHVMSAWLNGGRVVHVDLHPLHFSQTVAVGSCHPLVDVWMGPVAGTVLPLLIYLAGRRRWPAAGYALGYLAGFCAAANGLYIGISWVYPGHGDAHEMIRLGTPKAVLAAWGAAAAAGGLFIWHRELARCRTAGSCRQRRKEARQ